MIITTEISMLVEDIGTDDVEVTLFQPSLGQEDQQIILKKENIISLINVFRKILNTKGDEQ